MNDGTDGASDAMRLLVLELLLGKAIERLVVMDPDGLDFWSGAPGSVERIIREAAAGIIDDPAVLARRVADAHEVTDRVLASVLGDGGPASTR